MTVQAITEARGSPRTTAKLLCVVTCLLPACTTWRAQLEAPRAVLTSQRPERIRVTVAEGSRLVIAAPVVRVDSIAGLSEKGDSMAVALASVTGLDVRQADRMATAETIALVGIFVFLASKACFGLVSPCGGGS